MTCVEKNYTSYKLCDYYLSSSSSSLLLELELELLPLELELLLELEESSVPELPEPAAVFSPPPKLVFSELLSSDD